MQRLLMWLTMACLVALVCLCIVGAFLGAARAAEMFRSPLMAGGWFLLSAILLIGFIAFAAMRRLGMLAIHAGAMLILGGSMWGSPPGHALRAKYLDHSPTAKGYMRLFQNSADNLVLSADGQSVLGVLPFSVKLEKFWLEYYPADRDKWSVHFERVVDGRLVAQPINFRPGQRVTIGETDIKVELLDYLTDESRDTPALVVSANRRTRVLPFDLAQPIDLDLVDAKIQVLRVFKNMRVVQDGNDYVAIDSPGPGQNHALQVELQLAGPEPIRTYVFSPPTAVRIGQQISNGATLMYLPPATDRHGRLAPPIIKLRLSRKRHRMTGWLAPPEHATDQDLSLAELYRDEEQWLAAGAPIIAVHRPYQATKDYKSELVILEDGNEVARKVIEVNHPLHYGGYHFYQTGYDDEFHSYTVLTIASDSGLWAVYAGFALLVGGTVWQMWLKPLRRRKAVEGAE